MEKGTKLPAIVIGIAYLMACVILMGNIGATGFGFFELFATALIALPIVGGAWIGRQFNTEWVSILFYLAVILIAIWGYYEIWRVFFVLPSDPQGAIALLLGPFYQGMLVLGAACIAMILDRRVKSND